jgi:hypothetical protein
MRRPETAAIENAQRPTPNAQRSTLNAQRSTLNAQRSTLNAQRSTLNAQRSTSNAQRPTPNVQRPTSNRKNLDQLFCEDIRFRGCFGCFFGQAIELQIVEPAIMTGFLEQFGVGADFLDPAKVHDHDLIGR